ncbi:MAG: hypothetical protein D8H97_45560 [Neisseria sp.]|jgi:hypothetical protein|nr:MAG: hypothetical protein D8H97_45560 [Neisseria sp.]
MFTLDHNLHSDNWKSMKTSDKPHIQYLVQHGYIAGDVFPVYVVNDRETAMKKAKSLMVDIVASFRNDPLKKLDFVQDGYYSFWSESRRQEPGENFVSILVIRDGIITGQDHYPDCSHCENDAHGVPQNHVKKT